MSKRQSETHIPAVGEGKRGVEGHIGYLLRQAYAVHRSRLEQALQPLGLTLPQFSVLTMLSAYPGIAGADLARLSLLTPQTICVILNNLEKAGFIRRSAHPVHRRAQCIELSPAGLLMLKNCKQRVELVEQILLQGVPAKEEEVVRRWLVQLAMTDAMPMSEPR